MGEQFHKNSAGVRNMSLKMNTHFNRGRCSNVQNTSHHQTEVKSSAISRLASSSKESRLSFNKMRQNHLHQETTVKAKGKLQMNDVPPIENLHISKTEKGMKKIGIVHAVVDKLVIVKALDDTQQLELDSVLFLSSGNPLGQVFEKFGKHEPFYCIRFKNSEHIKSKGIVVDDEVFFVPDKTDAIPHAVEETAKKVNNSVPPSTNQSETAQNPMASDNGQKDGSGKQKKEVPVVSLKVLTNGTNGVAVYIPPCSSANTGNNAYSTLPKPVQSSAVRFVTDMQQNSHSNSFSPFPNVPLLPTPPVFRPFFPNYLFAPPQCQFPSTFGSMPAQNSLEMRFPTATPVPFPQLQQNMIPQANALLASSMMNYRPPNLLGQIPGLGSTSAPLQFPVSSHSPVSNSVPMLLPAGVNSTNVNPFLNPQMNFAQRGNPSLPLPASPPVKSLQWFQGHSIRKTK